MANLAEVTDAQFESEVVQSPIPVLIDFWAPWCAPCRAIAPVLEELAATYDGRVKIVKMNVDEHPNTPARFGVRGIPNLLVLKNGEVKEQLIGAVPKAQLVKAIDMVLAS